MEKPKKIKKWKNLTVKQRKEYVNQDTNQRFKDTRFVGSEQKLTELFLQNVYEEKGNIDRKIYINSYVYELKKIINNNLSRRQRTVIRFSLRGMSYNEMAETLETTNSVIRAIMFRAKQKIKKKLLQKFPQIDDGES